MSKMLFRMLGLLLISAFAITSLCSDEAATAKLKDSMEMLKSKTSELGLPKLDGSALLFGSTKLNGNYTIVDQIKEKNGCTATLFIKKGEDFVRISTNVVKEGNRAVGTKLDPNGPAIVAIRKSEAFAGVVDILGKKYDTIYEPIFNENKEVLGVYYVGILLEKAE